MSISATNKQLICDNICADRSERCMLKTKFKIKNVKKKEMYVEENSNNFF